MSFAGACNPTPRNTAYEPTIKEELLDELLKNYSQPGDLTGPEGLLSELKKRLINRVFESDLTNHLGYEKHQAPAGSSANARNGHSPKLLRSDHGHLPIKVPRVHHHAQHPGGIFFLAQDAWPEMLKSIST